MIFKTLAIVSWIVVSITSSAVAVELPKNWDCNHLLALSGEDLIGLRKDFDHQPKRYTYEIPTTPIDDQCQYGSCWIFATGEELQENLLRNKGITVDLSEDFVAIQSILIRAEDNLTYPGQQIAQGGWYAGARWLMLNRGVIPESAWKPRVPFMKGRAPDQLLGWLDARVSKYHQDTAVLIEQGATPEELATAYADAVKNLKEIVEVYTGPIPDTFVIDGKSMTAVEYAQGLFGDQIKSIRINPSVDEMHPSLEQFAELAKEKPLPTSNRIPYKTDATLAGPLPAVEKIILQMLKRKRPLAASIEINRTYIDNATGVMAVEAFNNPAGFEPTPKNYRQSFGQTFGGHLVEIVGADVDPTTGRIIKLKIKNSWGTKSQDQGFNHMYASYMRLYLNGVYFSANDAEYAMMTTTKPAAGGKATANGLTLIRKQ